MIQCDKGIVKIEGTQLDIYADFGVLLKVCREQLGDMMFNHLIEITKMSREEFHKETERARRELDALKNKDISGLSDLLKDIFDMDEE